MGATQPPSDQLKFGVDPVLLVRVRSADRAAATQGNPPLLELEVEEVLRGALSPGGSCGPSGRRGATTSTPRAAEHRA